MLRFLALTITPTHDIMLARIATNELLLYIVVQLVPTVGLKILIMRRGKLHKQPRTNIAYSRCMKKILLTNELTMSLSNN